MKEKLFKAELLNQKLSELEQQADDLERKEQEILDLKEALKTFEKIQEGDELLVPLARGIFCDAIATGSHTLKVNVGKSVVVEKTPEKAREMLDVQLKELRAYQERVRAEFEKGLKELRKMEEEYVQEAQREAEERSQ